jgi:hypothetical protein
VSRPGRGQVLRRLLVAAMTAPITVAGCLGESPSAAPTPTRGPAETPVVTRYELDTQVWYAGLVLTFTGATAELDPRGGPVTLSFGVENPGTEEAELNGPVTLAVGDTVFQPTVDSNVPEVGAGSVAAVVLSYDVEGFGSVDDAAIHVGESPQHVAVIPLRGGAPITLEPVPIAASGRATAAGLRVTLRAGELRWDLPDWSQELGDSVQALTLTYDATYIGSFSGGFAFTGENVQLRLPDGVLVDARRDGHSQSVELIAAGKTKKSLISRFEIPAGTTGRFALMVRSGSTVKGISFTIGG